MTNRERYGKVVELREKKIVEYKSLHADSHTGVRHLLSKYNIHNYTIYLHQLDDGKYYLFSHFEYSGNDFAADMQLLSEEPENQAWWQLTDPCQIPIRNRQTGEQWARMEEVYHND